MNKIWVRDERGFSLENILEAIAIFQAESDAFVRAKRKKPWSAQGHFSQSCPRFRCASNRTHTMRLEPGRQAWTCNGKLSRQATYKCRGLGAEKWYSGARPGRVVQDVQEDQSDISQIHNESCATAGPLRAECRPRNSTK